MLFREWRILNVFRASLSDDMRQQLYASLPSSSRVEFGMVSLQEALAVMRYTMSGATRPWLSLDRAAKIKWLPETLEGALEQAPDKWKPWLMEYGGNDCREAHPDPQFCLESFECLELQLQEALRACCQSLPEHSWVQGLMKAYQLEHVQTVSAAPNTSVKREQEARSEDAAVPPCKSVKSELTQSSVKTCAANHTHRAFRVTASAAQLPVHSNQSLVWILGKFFVAASPPPGISLGMTGPGT